VRVRNLITGIAVFLVIAPGTFFALRAFTDMDSEIDHAPSLATVIVPSRAIQASLALDPLIEEGVFVEFQVPVSALVEGAVTDVDDLKGAHSTALILKHEQIATARLAFHPGIEGEILTAAGPWFDAEGKPIPDDNPFPTVVFQRSTFCGYESVLFFHLPWPLGASTVDLEELRFVRDATGEWTRSSSATTFDPDSRLPARAYDTGYHRGDWHLWVVDSRITEAVWLVHGDTVERWPAAKRRVCI
jgi:hypothetical protein